MRKLFLYCYLHCIGVPPGKRPGEDTIRVLKESSRENLYARVNLISIHPIYFFRNITAGALDWMSSELAKSVWTSMHSGRMISSGTNLGQKDWLIRKIDI